MSENEITLTSTTNTPDEIRVALGEPVAPIPPVTPPAPAEPVAPAPAVAATPDAPAVVPPKVVSKSAARIAALVAERNEEARARRAAEDRALALETRLNASQPAAPTTEAAPAAAPAPVTVDIGPEPKEEDFGGFSEFNAALVKYNVKKALAEAGANVPVQKVVEEAIAKTTEETNRIKEADAAYQTFQDRLGATKTKYPDFQAKLDEAAPRAPVSEFMKDVLIRSEIPGELLYFFAEHPEEAQRIARLPQRASDLEMGKIEARVQSTLATAPAAAAAVTPAPVAAPVVPAAPVAPAPPVSLAPPPIAPVGASGGTTLNVPLEEMPYEQYKKIRESGGARK